MGDNNIDAAAAEVASAIRDTTDAGQEATPSSLESTPEPSTNEIVQDQAQPQKRKGGRKPVRRDIIPSQEDLRLPRSIL